MILCLVCNHGFSWRIAPLERVCAQCGALHVLKSGLWTLPTGGHGHIPVPAARAIRQTASRLSVMKMVPSLGTVGERQAKS